MLVVCDEIKVFLLHKLTGICPITYPSMNMIVRVELTVEQPPHVSALLYYYTERRLYCQLYHQPP